MFQHTAARRRLPSIQRLRKLLRRVSTHSRAEAAASYTGLLNRGDGGFQHTAVRRRLPLIAAGYNNCLPVSTHSRAEAAAIFSIAIKL